MKFDTLAKHILEGKSYENFTVKPKYDGKREIYTTYVTVTEVNRKYSYTLYDLYRIRASDQFDEWDDESVFNTMFYDGRDYKEAYRTFQAVLYNEKKFAAHEEIVSHLLREARKLKDLIGNFRVFHAADDYVFGVEVDVGASRSTEIQNTLHNIDTAGLEDLF